MLRLDSFAGNNKRLSRSDFGPEQLLHALCAAMGVPDRSKLAEIFRHLAKYFVRPWRRPKNTIACRDQPRADSAFLLPCAGFGRRDLRLGWKTQMYIFQSPASSDLCVFLCADSSPQAGTDWLLTQMRIIPPGKLSKRRAPCHGLQVGDGEAAAGSHRRISGFSRRNKSARSWTAAEIRDEEL